MSMFTSDLGRGARLGFAGEIVEAGAFLYVLHARIYSPALHRFLSADVLSPMAEGGIHRYAYCAGDPVNRVDPHGDSFFDWLLSGVGLVGALVGLAGTIAAIPTGGASLAATAALWGAVALETASVAAEVGSVVANATGESELGGVLGWVALATGLGAGGAGAASKVISNRARAAATRGVAPSKVAKASSGPRRSGDLVTKVNNRVFARLQDLPGERIYLDGGGNIKVTADWHPIVRSERAGRIVHAGFDTAVDGNHIDELVRSEGGAGKASTPIYVYSGVHGMPNGQNWLNGVRQNPNPTAIRQDLSVSQWTVPASPGRAPRQLIHISGLSLGGATEAWRRPGMHIHAYCYSAVDELLLQMFNHPPVTVYI